MMRVVRVALGSGTGTAEALEEVRQKAGAETIGLAVSLLPPLVQLRHIALPRMTEDEARKVIARNASRYFADARDPQTVAVSRVGTDWLVAIAPEAIVSAIHEAAGGYGWQVASIVPAHVYWSRAAGDGQAAVFGSCETAVLETTRGRITAVRRSRPNAPLPSDLAAARTVAQGDAEADLLASRFQRSLAVLDLVPEPIRTRRAGVARRAAAWLAGASAALLLLAAGLGLVGERRELNAIRDHRAAIKEDVSAAVASRDTLLHLTEHLNTVAALERSSERWSGVIAGVAAALPIDASLTAFRAEADSVTLEGQASDAGGVFAAMRTAPRITAVRASAPVRQEGGRSEGEPIIQRFTMAAHIERPRGTP